MRIREATPEDAEAIERIRVRGWQTAYRAIFPPELLDAMPVDWSRWEGRLESPPEGWSILVAETGGNVVGFAATGPDRDDALRGELFALYVDPGRWSSGAGRALLAAGEEELARLHAEATLWVLEANARARRFYERGGWELDDATRRFELATASALTVRYRKLLTTSASRS
jgi:GNAT superfamily N-acetyltransferase